jgi:hypothetical protein
MIMMKSAYKFDPRAYKDKIHIDNDLSYHVLCSCGEIIEIVIFVCHSCKYRASISCGDLEFMQHHVRMECPKCGVKLTFEQAKESKVINSGSEGYD